MRCEPMALNGASNAYDILLCQHSLSCFKEGYLYFVFFPFKMFFNTFAEKLKKANPRSKNT